MAYLNESLKRFFESLTFIVWFLIFILTAWLLGLWYDLAFLIWWFDIPLHFLGGLWVFSAARFLFGYFNINISGRREKSARFFIFLGITALTGVVWEFAEFVFDRHISGFGLTYLPNVFEDTLLDLLMDLLGGFVGILLL